MGPYIHGALLLCGKSYTNPRCNYYRQANTEDSSPGPAPGHSRLPSSSFSFYPPLSCSTRAALTQQIQFQAGSSLTWSIHPWSTRSPCSEPPLTSDYTHSALSLGGRLPGAAALPALAHQAPSSLSRQGPPASKLPYRAGAETEACDLGLSREEFRVNGRDVWRDNNSSSNERRCRGQWLWEAVKRHRTSGCCFLESRSVVIVRDLLRLHF